MYFDSFADFLAMGRHGLYVWSAYGISLGLILINLVTMTRRYYRVRADIRHALRRERMTRMMDGDEQGT